MSVRVFVVDDTAHVRKMLVQMLELSGFDIVGQAASGTEAVENIGDADPQVVVVDYKMPGLDGIETAREIRAHRPDQAIILYTAYLDDTPQTEAAAAGVSLCVGKIEGLPTLERARPPSSVGSGTIPGTSDIESTCSPSSSSGVPAAR